MLKILKYLFLALLTLASPKAFGLAEFQHTIQTVVPSAVDVSSINASAASGTINPETGNSSAPYATFQIQSNGNDDKYDYILTAKVNTSDSRNLNAYSQNGSITYLLLGNVANLPTSSAINDIKTNSPTTINNKNVIAYPIINTFTNLSSATLTDNAAYGGLCYVIKTGSNQKGTIKQAIGTTPMNNTYSSITDTAGTYQAVLTLTANRKP